MGTEHAVMHAQGTTLPLGRCVARGNVRWYLVRCPKGRERATCKMLRQCVPAELLEDAFVPRTERIKKVHGEWTRPVRDLFEGYFIVATKDAPSLARALAKLTFSVQLVGAVGRGFAPVDKDAQVFLESCMDGSHVIRSSEGEIVRNELHVTHGPLRGKESRVSRCWRRKALAYVNLGDTRSGTFTLAMPLAIMARR